MPEIGEIRKGKEIGKLKSYNKYIWSTCVCGKSTRWVVVRDGKPKSIYCHSCTTQGKKNSRWNGGRYCCSGYIRVRLEPSDFYFPMTNKKGNVFEHRLVMARHLNRCLLAWEIVHHRNGIKDDNRLVNLQLLPNNVFQVSDSRLKRRVAELEKKVTLLEAENTLLKKQLRG